MGVDERNLKMEKKVEKDFAENFDTLSKNKTFIRDMLGRKFCTFNIDASLSFSTIYNKANYLNENECGTITEKIISRSHAIKYLKYSIDNYETIKEEVEDLKELWDLVSYSLIPLELFWCMEYEKEDDAIFSDLEQSIFDYFNYIANYYLSETDKMYKMYIENKNKQEQIKELKKVNKNEKK